MRSRSEGRSGHVKPRDHVISFSAAEYHTTAAPDVRRDTRATDRITNRDCAQNRTNNPSIICFCEKETRRGRGRRFEIKSCPLRIQDKTFPAQAKILVPEKFHVATTAPGMIGFQISVAMIFA